jgi:hypothetical protein
MNIRLIYFLFFSFILNQSLAQNKSVTSPKPTPKSENKASTKKFVVYFDVNKAIIKSEDYKVLDSAVQFIQNNQNIKRVQVNGYADTTGNSEANFELSNNRTDTVANYIINKGGLLNLKNKFNTASFGEKVSGKEMDLDEMRRVEILVVFAKPDRDTLIRLGCYSALIPAYTFDGYNNDELNFSLEVINTDADLKKYNISMKDDNGNKMISNGIVKLNVTYKNKIQKPTKPIIYSLPVLNNLNNYKVYIGQTNKDKSVTWKVAESTIINTIEQFPDLNEPCFVQKFSLKDCNNLANCLQKSPECYCSPSAFGGVLNPSKNDIHAKFGENNGIALFTDENVKKANFEKLKIKFHDNVSLEELNTVCNAFMFPGITDVPEFPKYTREVIRFLDIDVCQHNDSAELIMNKKSKITVFIPKNQLQLHKGKTYAIAYADTRNDDFLNWTNKLSFMDSCKGLTNCDYYTFEVPFSGFYVLVELTPIDKKGGNAGDDLEIDSDNSKAKPLTIKVKKFNDVTFIYYDKDELKTKYSDDRKNKGKHNIHKLNDEKKKTLKPDLILVHKLVGGKHYAWIGMGKSLKKAWFGAKLKTPKMKYIPDDQWRDFIEKWCKQFEQ